MRGHLGTRIAQIIPTLLLVSVLVFCLQQLMPGDPALVMAGEERGDPQVLAQIRSELWLDRSLPVQYLSFIRDVLRGDFELNMSDQQIDECVAVMKVKGTGDAPHPFFA